MALNFWRMCIANLLLFASVYMLFPILPFIMSEQLDISVSRIGNLFLTFIAGLFIVGPLHAFLGDKYKRKSVLLYSVFLILLATLGYLFVDNYSHLLLLALIQGSCFGLAITAGITVAIDITASTCRSAGNTVYAWTARLGMLLGAISGWWIYRMEGFQQLVFFSLAVGLLCMLFLSRVHVVFRAPIGLNFCSFDRFLLRRAWLPAFNLFLIAFVPGVLLPLMFADCFLSLLGMGILVLIIAPFTRMFVKLSNHCQRGTANTTSHLSVESGMFMGMAVTCYFSDEVVVYHIASAVAILSLLLFILLTYPYYKKKRVR